MSERSFGGWSHEDLKQITFDDYWASAPLENPNIVDGSNGANTECQQGKEVRMLHVCQNQDCSSTLVQIEDWQETPGTQDMWDITLYCPECGWWEEGTFDDSLVGKFDDALVDAEETIHANLKVLARENMEADVEVLTRAIENGDIQPIDF